jgi:hypothetical protein
MQNTLFGIHLICYLISAPSLTIVGDTDNIVELAYMEGLRIRLQDTIREKLFKMKIDKKFCSHIKSYIKKKKGYFLYKYRKQFPFIIISPPSYVLKLGIKYGIKVSYPLLQKGILYGEAIGYWEDVKEEDKDKIDEYVKTKIDMRKFLSKDITQKLSDNLAKKLFSEVIDEIW